MILLLYALYNGRKVRANKELSRQGSYKCPDPNCKSPDLILKLGIIRTPHFSHKKNSKCNTYSEPETESHIAMKLFLKEQLNVTKDGIESTRIAQVRPDILWNRIAIELQHSSITLKEVIRRNNIYYINGYTPIWILHQADSNYYENGNFGKKRSKDLIKLKVIEEFLLKSQGCLLYISFKKQKESNKLPRTIFRVYYFNDEINYSTTFKIKESRMIRNRKELRSILSELSEIINNLFHKKRFYLDYFEEIPKKLQQEVIIRSNKRCETCKKELLTEYEFDLKIKELESPIKLNYFENHECPKCKEKTPIINYRGSLDGPILEQKYQKILAERFRFYENSFMGGYKNSCINCWEYIREIMEITKLKEWIYSIQIPNMKNEYILILLDRVKISKKRIYFNIGFKENPYNLSPENLLVMCGNCFNKLVFGE